MRCTQTYYKTGGLFRHDPPRSGGYTSYPQFVRQQYVRRYAVDENSHLNNSNQGAWATHWRFSCEPRRPCRFFVDRLHTTAQLCEADEDGSAIWSFGTGGRVGEARHKPLGVLIAFRLFGHLRQKLLFDKLNKLALGLNRLSAIWSFETVCLFNC